MTDTKKLKARIIEKGYTMASFSVKLNTNTASLSQKINNKARFSQDDIKKIGEILQLTDSDLRNIFFKL